jgi:hypothetical protein
MLFHLYGHPINQTKVAEALFKTSKPPCHTASPGAILNLLNRDWKDDNGDGFKCRTDAMYDQFAGVDTMDPQQIIDSLKAGDPLILCTTHHCMVLTEVHYRDQSSTYKFGPLSRNEPTSEGPIITEMGVADPWPGCGLRSLNCSEGVKVWAGGELSILANVVLEAAKPS